MPLLVTALVVSMLPLSMPDAWTLLSYRGILSHRVAFSDDGLRIEVRRSAGPVVHRFPDPMMVAGVTARGRIVGRVETTPARQGARGHDDFALRIGLIEAGDRRPSFFERRLAPGWVRHLFSLAPPGAGVARIRFLNVGLSATQVGWSRRHPLSDLLVEEVVAVPDEAGRFDFTVETTPASTLGIWLAADGDDTGSSFEVHLEHLSVVPASLEKGTVPISKSQLEMGTVPFSGSADESVSKRVPTRRLRSAWQQIVRPQGGLTWAGFCTARHTVRAAVHFRGAATGAQ